MPALAGLTWISRALRIFVRRPGGFMSMFGFVLLALVVLMLTPPVVQMFSLVLMPLLSLGFMQATEDVQNDLRARPSAFWVPLTSGTSAARGALLKIGVVYVTVFALIYFFGDNIDGGEAKKWLETIFTPQPDGSLPQPTPLSGMGLFVLALKSFGLAIVSIPLWHAPALVHWGRQGAAQAMFSSIVSLWRTRAAFAVYLLGWLVVGLLFLAAIVTLTALVGSIQMAVALMTPVSWALSAVFYLSIWFSFVDTFQITSAPNGAGAAADPGP